MVIKLCFVFLLLCAVLHQDILISAQSDICSEPLTTGICKAYLIRYGYNKTEGRCVEFVYGGCGENRNNFETLKECLSACKSVCLQPLKVGRCRASIPRFGFNSEEEKCVHFIYGGCDANGNNFETIEECQGQCEATKMPQLTVAEG